MVQDLGHCPIIGDRGGTYTSGEQPRIFGRYPASRYAIILRLGAGENTVRYQHRNACVWRKCIAQRKVTQISGSEALVRHPASRNSNKKSGTSLGFSLARRPHYWEKLIGRDTIVYCSVFGS